VSDGAETQLPGYWRFLWLFFMQPVSLHHQIKACGLEPDTPGWKLLRKKGRAPFTGAYVRRLGFVLAAGPVGAALVLLVFKWLGVPVDLVKLAVGVAFGVAVGVAGGVALI
jgi:hypothetical protein